MNNLVDVAQAIALTAHGGQVNKHDGELYLLHVHRVSILTRTQFGGDEIAVASAWLHDVVEDTPWTFEDVFQGLLDGLGARNSRTFALAHKVLDAVKLLTKVDGQDLEEYYRAIAAHPIARLVKLADMTDNFSRNHLIKDPEKRSKMAYKYSLGMDILSPRGIRV